MYIDRYLGIYIYVLDIDSIMLEIISKGRKCISCLILYNKHCTGWTSQVKQD